MSHTLFVLVSFVLTTLFSYHNHCILQIIEQFRLEWTPGIQPVQSPASSKVKVNSEYSKVTSKKKNN